MRSAAVRRYWTKVASLGCLICQSPAEIAHAHGGSIVERMQEPKAKGRKLPAYDWLVIPLCERHHRVGPTALDNDVEAWETVYGDQAAWIDRLRERTGIDAWAQARALQKPAPQRALSAEP